MKTLVEKANEVPLYGAQARRQRRDARFSEKELQELAIAWIKNEVSFTQAAKVLGMTGSTVYSTFLIQFKRLYAAGRIKIK